MIDFETYTVEPEDKVLVVALSGQLDTDSCEYFFSCLEEEIERGHIQMMALISRNG